MFMDDGSKFDERDFREFVQGLPTVDLIKFGGLFGHLISFVFRFGAEEVDVELVDGLEVVVLHSENSAAFEFSILLQKKIVRPLRITNESYTFDSLISDFVNYLELEKAFLSS